MTSSSSSSSSSAAPVKLTGKPAEISAFLSRYDVFLFDCDGVIWSGTHIIPGALESLSLLRSLGKTTIFVTNNSTKSRASYISKFTSLGIPVTPDEIFSSSYSAAIYISRVLKLPKDKRVFVLGEAGIEEELTLEGVKWFTDYEDWETVELPDDTVGAVLCGLDRNINYGKLAKAFQYLHKQPEIQFLATNIDSTFPSHGRLLPGAGSCSAPLAFMTGREPVSLGKPSQAMMDAIEGVFRFDRTRACMVGDRLNTDIKFGREGGLGTLAVLTGVAKEDDLLDLNAEVRPDAYLESLGDLVA